MELLAALRLQIEWGADEALDTAPVQRTAPVQPSLPAAVAPTASVASPPSRQVAVAAAVPGGAAVRAQAAAARATSLGELEAELAGFDGCALSVTATSLVFGYGSPTASLMVVGDVPGADEDRLGQPFAGRDGQLLDRLLGSIGLSRDHVRLALAVPWRPPGGRQPTGPEIAACAPFLHRHIALVAPSHLLAIGALSARALLGEAASPIRSRGRWVAAQVPGVNQPLPTVSFGTLQQIATRAEHKVNAWAGLRQICRTFDQANR